MTLLKQLQSFCNMRYFNRPLVSTDSKPLRKQGNRPASAPIESGPGRAACRRSMRFGRAESSARIRHRRTALDHISNNSP